MLTPRDIQVVCSVARYHTLTRSQITRLHFSDDDDGRITRKRLQELLKLGLIHRTNMQVVNPLQGAPAPVYYPSREGCEFAVQETGDLRYRTCSWQTPVWQTLYHFVAVAETHMMLDRAASQCDGVSVAEWFGEESIVNPDGRRPEDRYRLYTRLSDELVCVPDAAFLLEKGAHQKAFYLEQDRDTTKNAARVAAQKHAGYFGLAGQQGHRRHFPTVTASDFNVLMVAPTERRRDALRAAFAAKPGAKMWRFASLTELRADSFLDKAVWHHCDGSVRAILLNERGAV